MKYARYILMICATGTAVLLYAQSRQVNSARRPAADFYQPYIDAIAGYLNGPVLKYRYRIMLYNEKSGESTDSLSGMIYKAGNEYIDSNVTGISLLAKGYFCKINEDHKTILVCSIPAMEKRFGIKKEDMNNTLLSITDSTIRTLGNITVKEEKNGIVLYYTAPPQRSDLHNITFFMNKVGNAVQKIIMTVNDPREKNPLYLKQLTIYNISNTPEPALLRTDRYFSITGKKLVPVNKYKKYKASTLLQ